MTYPTVVMSSRSAPRSSCSSSSFDLRQDLQGLRGKLPLPTQIVMMASDFLKATGGPRAGVRRCRHRVQALLQDGERQDAVDRLLLKVPVFGEVLRKSAIADSREPWGR